MIFRDEPALARGALAPVLDLPRDRFLIVGYAVLLVLFASVDDPLSTRVAIETMARDSSR